jgi:hypothetical protein
MSKEDVDRLERHVLKVVSGIGELTETLRKHGATVNAGASADAGEPVPDGESQQQHPPRLTLNQTSPELVMEVQPRELKVDENQPRGRVATLIADGFFQTPRSGNEAYEYWKARGFSSSSSRIYEALESLMKDGLLVMVERKKYVQHPNLKVTRNGQKTVTLTINYK